MARPCRHCVEEIRAHGVTRIVYSDRDGSLARLRAHSETTLSTGWSGLRGQRRRGAETGGRGTSGRHRGRAADLHTARA